MADADTQVENKSDWRSPVKYKSDEHPEEAYEYCRENGRIALSELAEHMGVSRQAVQAWYYNFPEFAEAYQRGVDEYMTWVAESALEEMINGRTRVETTTRTRETTQFDKQGNPHTVEEKETVEREKVREPDMRAVLMWLQSRIPERWPADVEQAGKHQHVHFHQEVKNSLKDMDNEQLKQLVSELTGKGESDGGSA